MSVDDKAEENVWGALRELYKVEHPRPKRREKMFREIVVHIMNAMGWTEVKLTEKELEDEKGRSER